MGRSINKLTDRKIKSFVATCKAEGKHGAKMSDGAGMFVTVTPAGSAAWRLKYRLHGVEKLYAIGTYPDISLEAARAARAAARDDIRAGRDPVATRRKNREDAAGAAGQTFEVVARDWLEKRRDEWSKVHYRTSLQAIERDLMPALGPLPIASITPAMIATTIEKIVNRGAHETASKVLWNCGRIFELAQARGLCRDNPSIPARAVLPRLKPDVHRPALTEWAGLGDVLRRARAENLTRAVYMAHRLIAFTAARISNVVAAEWIEFDLDGDAPMWVIPRSKMKASDRPHDHKVLLGTQIVAELRAWRGVVGGDGFVFDSPQAETKRVRVAHSHISRESIEKAYRVTMDLADQHTPHGWRAAFSTLARDGGFPRDAVEIALDHVHDNDVVRAYDRGERLEQRIKLAQWWGDQLTAAEAAASV